MAQYKVEDITNVFWATNDGFKVGRDPMGIQNSSIATYAALLPGLTNLTGHIRYYSLYCWLLSEYKKIWHPGENEVHQYNFIRRAELALAYIMKDHNVNAVVGANYVYSNQITDSEGYYDIAKGADYQKKQNNSYWSYQTGAFGQYYLGSLIYFGLVRVESNSFILTDKGEGLAEALRNSVDTEPRELFIACIIEGTINVSKIEDLSSLGLDAIELFSEEWKELNRLLISEDKTTLGNSSLRRESIYLMLKDIQKGQSVDTFVEHRFKMYEKNKEIGAAFGWLFYFLCEVLHFSVETIFCFMLDKMGQLHNPPIGVLLEEAGKEIKEVLDVEQLYDTVRDWKSECYQDISLTFSDLKSFVKSKDYPHAVAVSIPLLLRLLNEYESYKGEADSFEERNNLKRQNGILSKGLREYVCKYLNSEPSTYIDALLNKVLNEHTFVAISKMGTSNSDLRKFIIEDGRAVLIEERTPNLTNPRITSLYNFLKDLSYLDFSNGVADKFMENYH